MGTLPKSAAPGFLVVLLAGLLANNNTLYAYAVDQVVIPTGNESLSVELSFPGFFAGDIVTDDTVTIGEPQQVALVVRFLDPATDTTIEDVNYSLVVAYDGGDGESESVLLERRDLYVPDGIDPHLVPFLEAGSFTLTVDVEGTGIERPFDTTYSGTASLTITIVPEFPAAIVAIMGATIAMAIAVSRFGKPFMR